MPEITKKSFGTVESRPVELYILKNDRGSVAEITDYGATLVSLKTADRDGNFDDIVLGYDTAEEYTDNAPYFGATIGRVGNRISNGRFTLNGISYQLARNENGKNHLHGGFKGFNKVIWRAEEFTDDNQAGIKFTYTSPDGEENYPGKLDVEVIYSLTNNDELKISFRAETDKETPVNMTHHSYFNLNGEGSGTILDHTMMINASRYTPSDDELIPTGDIEPAEGALDFTTPQNIGEKAAQTENGGFDNNYLIDQWDGSLKLAAVTKSPKSGRVMETWTTEPAIQLYTSNYLDAVKGKGGRTYDKHAAFCLEPQHCPDAVNKPQFKSIILKPQQQYKNDIIYKFSTEK